jgi:protein involved in ribonucleotide reduction
MQRGFKLSLKVVYFSNYSGNTKRFVDKLELDSIRIPIDWDPVDPVYIEQEYVLMVPTYGGGSDKSSIPKQVVKFLNIPNNRTNLRAIVGLGNTNFGEHYCKAAEMISAKTGAPVIARVEIFGTNDDVIKVKERLALI